MTKHWILLILTAFVIAAPSAAEAAPAKSPPKTKKDTKPTNKPPMPPGMPRSGPPTGHAVAGQRPPGAPTPVSSKNSFEVPQARTLSDTPDVVLNSRVRASLLAALSTSGQEILTKTTKGVVTLSGSVPTKSLRARAEQAARKVTGVRGVKNQIKVKSSTRVSKG
jgi:hyperosmotically inducible protein